MNRMMITILALAGFSLAAMPDLEKLKDYPDAPHYRNTTTWGGGIGVVQGYGITMRKWFETSGMNVNLMPILYISGKEQNIRIDLGIEYLHALWEGRMYEFMHQPSRNLVYAYTGAQYLVDRYKTNTSDYPENYMQNDITLGGGLGLQMNFGAVQLSTGLGFAGYWNKLDDTNHPTNSGTEYGLEPSIELNLGYTFGWK